MQKKNYVRSDKMSIIMISCTWAVSQRIFIALSLSVSSHTLS